MKADPNTLKLYVDKQIKDIVEKPIHALIDLHNDVVDMVAAIRENKISLSALNSRLSSCVVSIRESLREIGIDTVESGE